MVEIAVQPELYFDAVLPTGQDLLWPKEVAAACGVNEDYIREACELGDLKSFNLSKTQAAGRRNYTTYRIPRSAAIAWLASHANFTAGDLLQELEGAVLSLPAPMQKQLFKMLSSRL